MNSTTKETVPMPPAEALLLMLDKMALHELVQDYCRAVDRRDYALLESLYHPDSIDDHSPMFKGSGPDFVRWVPSSVARFVLTQHVITSAQFVVDGALAEGECHIVAYHLSKKEPQRETIAHGRYLDRYEKRAGVWRILYRKIVYDWSEARPYDKEVFARISRGSTMASPDNNDPLYTELKLFQRGARLTDWQRLASR
jgi:hypothetical protein